MILAPDNGSRAASRRLREKKTTHHVGGVDVSHHGHDARHEEAARLGAERHRRAGARVLGGAVEGVEELGPLDELEEEVQRAGVLVPERRGE